MLLIPLTAPEKRAEVLKPMTTSAYWPARLLAAAGALGNGASGKATLETLADDEELVVKKFAEAALDDLAHPATQPTTGPSTAPGLVPATAPTSMPSIDLRL